MVSVLYDFFNNLWKLGRINNERLYIAVDKGYIDHEEMNNIINGV